MFQRLIEMIPSSDNNQQYYQISPTNSPIHIWMEAKHKLNVFA